MHLADQFTLLLENHPEYVVIFYESRHANHDVNSCPPTDTSNLQSDGHHGGDRNCIKVNGWTSVCPSQQANENSSVSSSAMEVQPSLPHTIQTTVTIEIEEY